MFSYRDLWDTEALLLYRNAGPWSAENSQNKAYSMVQKSLQHHLVVSKSPDPPGKINWDFYWEPEWAFNVCHRAENKHKSTWPEGM